MTGPESYDVSKLLTAAQARKLLSYIIANGTVVILQHAKDAAGDDGKADVDIWNVLKAGQIHEPGEWDDKFAQWRYRFHTARFGVAVAFEEKSRCVVVTFWQKKGGA
ncbi:MAG: hypothetical protein A2138_20425 [Deltaproteobacteria bacterium RBG_16_71_12]|nr:MAG: hypothetical protein A2138_20425 [Deltaproteobacteria bacterium RBG_16_71_12]